MSRSLLDEQDRRWLASKRDRTALYVMLFIGLLFCIAYPALGVLVGGWAIAMAVVMYRERKAKKQDAGPK